MKQTLNDLLLEGEKILWSGRPAPFQLMHSPSRNYILATWAACAVFFCLGLGFLIPYQLQHDNTLLEILFLIAITAFLPTMIAVRPLLDKRCLEHSTMYAITNVRAMVVVKGNLIYMPLSPETRTCVKHFDGRHGTLCFGSSTEIGTFHELAVAVQGVRFDNDSSPDVSGVLFYHINDPESVLRSLSC